MKYKLTLLLVIIIFSCKKKEKAKCNLYYNKYINASFNENKDSSLFYIEKAVICNPKDKLYRNEKLKVLLFKKKYKSVLKELDFLDKDIYYNVLKGLLYLKLDMKKEGNTILDNEYKKVVNVRRSKEKQKFRHFYYGLLLINYYEGKENGLKLIRENGVVYTGINELDTLKHTEKLIEENTPINVLNLIFGLNN